jgi:hypothetical protein
MVINYLKINDPLFSFYVYECKFRTVHIVVVNLVKVLTQTLTIVKLKSRTWEGDFKNCTFWFVIQNLN